MFGDVVGVYLIAAVVACVGDLCGWAGLGLLS